MELMDNLETAKWREGKVGEKKDFKEYQIGRQHQQVNDSTIRYVISNDDDDPAAVIMEGLKAKKDPIKCVTTCEFKLNADKSKIVGIDLDGDIVLFKG